MFTPNSTPIRQWAAASGAWVQASTPAQAARPRITVHAGPNSQFGGFQLGLRSAAYQAPTWVVSPPTASSAIVSPAATTIVQVMFALRGAVLGPVA